MYKKTLQGKLTQDPWNYTGNCHSLITLNTKYWAQVLIMYSTGVHSLSRLNKLRLKSATLN